MASGVFSCPQVFLAYRGQSVYETATITVSGIPSGATITRAVLSVTPARATGTVDSSKITRLNVAWGDRITKNIDYLHPDRNQWDWPVTGNGNVDLTFGYKSGISSASTLVMQNISLVVEWIDPVSQFTLVSSTVEAGGVVTANIQASGGGYTHRLRIVLGSMSGTASGGGSTLSYSIPLSWVDQMPNSVSGGGIVYLDTFDGGTLLGTVSKSLTITVPSSVLPTAGE